MKKPVWRESFFLGAALAVTTACSNPPPDAAAEMQMEEQPLAAIADGDLSTPEMTLEVGLAADVQRRARVRGSYHAISASESLRLSQQDGPDVRIPGGPPLAVFMNRYGGTYTGGNDDSAINRSSIVPGASAVVGPFNRNDATWDAVMACTQDMFSRFNVVVTDVEPTSGDYIESVVGGHPSELGLPNGVGGVAPIDPYQCRLLDQAIVYTFTQNLPNSAQIICEVVAQEVAHAMSLDHQYLCTDPMSYLDGCGTKEFRDEASQCGEYSARQCNCNRPSQNSVQILLEKLGPSDGTIIEPPPPDDIDPTVSIVSPGDQDTLPENSEIQVVATADDNNGLAAVELEWDFSGSNFGCPASGQGWSCAVSGDERTWTLNVGTGSRTFRVRARDLSGNVVTTESRTINLGAGGEPDVPTPEPVPEPTPEPAPTPEPTPDPVDEVPPDADILSPADGATLPAYEPMTVTASISDDVEVGNVFLEWDFSGDTFPCPYESQAVQCAIDGSQFTWTVSVGIGDRSFRVRAQDATGNEATTGTRTITLSQAQVPPPPADDDNEDDDTFDTAAALACGSTVDRISITGDDDWFFVSTGTGVQVTATLSTTATLTLRASTGSHSSTTVAESDSGTLTFVAPGDVGLRVRGTSDGDYRLTLTCTAPPTVEPDPTPEGPSPEGTEPETVTPGEEPEAGSPDVPQTPGLFPSCGQAEGSTSIFGLALVALAFLRRRRRR